jgi:hypothetical protein
MDPHENKYLAVESRENFIAFVEQLHHAWPQVNIVSKSGSEHDIA